MKLVTVDHLEPGMVLGRTIFGSRGQILLNQGVTLSSSYITFLRKHFIDVVYVADKGEVFVHDVISDQTRVEALAATREVLGQVKKGADLEIDKINQVLIGVIDELLLQEDIMINLVDIRSFSEELFSHTINVSILSVIIGIELRYTKTDLTTLAMATLLHDVGKLLTDEDDANSHPRVGFDLLRRSAKVNPQVMQVTLQHHEHFDGSGYPKGLKGEEIHEFSRILLVADTFDNLSANNKYPMEEVIEYLMAGSGSKFDPKVVRAFIDCVSFYPVGTNVRLNTGECGVVVRSNKGFPTRPVVRIERNILGGLVEPGYEINLVERTTYFITKKIDETGSGERYEL